MCQRSRTTSSCDFGERNSKNFFKKGKKGRYWGLALLFWFVGTTLSIPPVTVRMTSPSPAELKAALADKRALLAAAVHDYNEVKAGRRSATLPPEILANILREGKGGRGLCPGIALAEGRGGRSYRCRHSRSGCPCPGRRGARGWRERKVFNSLASQAAISCWLRRGHAPGGWCHVLLGRAPVRKHGPPLL